MDLRVDTEAKGFLVTETKFLPAERLPQSQILEQAGKFGENTALTAMLDTSPGMVALLNPQRQIVFCNIACAKAGGLRRKEEALGMRPGELLRCIHAHEMPAGCGASDSCRYCGLAEALASGTTGGASSGECLMQCRDDAQDVSAEYEVQVTPLPGLGKGWQCYSLNDVSGEKRREALERTFFHDILNRASAVESVSNVLAEEDISPEERHQFIGSLSISARALVEEICSHRTLLAAEKGELAVRESTDCDSLEALQQAADACQTFGFSKGKGVTLLSGAQSVLFQTDIALLGRILVNLLKNALEASGPGMTVTATCTGSTPGCVRFSVHNDAVMPGHIRAHVFQRSFSTKGSGRGLGTYSVKLLAENYLDGRAWFDSTEGSGTTFYAEFPT